MSKPIFIARVPDKYKCTIETFEVIERQLKDQIGDDYHCIVATTHEQSPVFELFSVKDIQQVEIDRLQQIVLESIKPNPKMSKPNTHDWVSVNDDLPKPLQTVWLTNGKGWVCLGCLVESDGGWHWAQSNGIIYAENGEIVAECESEDLDVQYWHELPKLPTTN